MSETDLQKEQSKRAAALKNLVVLCKQSEIVDIYMFTITTASCHGYDSTRPGNDSKLAWVA